MIANCWLCSSTSLYLEPLKAYQIMSKILVGCSLHHIFHVREFAVHSLSGLDFICFIFTSSPIDPFTLLNFAASCTQQ